MPQNTEWDLNKVIHFIHKHTRIEDIHRAEQVLKKSIKETESKERISENLYYLIRCKLMRNSIFETPECQKLYKDMCDMFKEVEKAYLADYKKNPNEITKAEVCVFYMRVEHYLGNLKKIYDKKNFNDASERAHIDEMNTRKYRFWFQKDYFHYLAYFLFDLTSKYGNSMGRWFFTSFLVMMFFGFSFFIIDFLTRNHTMIDISNGYHVFDYFYYSIITFVTLGYGDIIPVTIVGKILASVEVLVGYHMLGMLVTLLARKM